MSKFPPRLLGRYQKLISGEEFFTAIEEHRIYPAWMKNEYIVPYISEQEHTATIQALSEKLEKGRAIIVLMRNQLLRAKASADNHVRLDISADCFMGIEMADKALKEIE